MMNENTLTDPMTGGKRRWTNGQRLGIAAAALLVVVATLGLILNSRPRGSYWYPAYQSVCPNEIESWAYYDGAYYPYLVYVPSDGSSKYKFISFRKYMIVGDDPHEYSNGEGCSAGGFRMEGRDDENQMVESYELKIEDDATIGTVFYIDENPYDLYEQGTLFFIWGDSAVEGRTVTMVETDLSNVVPIRESVQAFVESNQDVLDFFKKIAEANNENEN